jgi:gliding motility-associated lipoprotein GldH
LPGVYVGIEKKPINNGSIRNRANFNSSSTGVLLFLQGLTVTGKSSPMKNNIQLLVLLLLILGFFSCAPQKAFEDIHTFPDATWHRFDILSFDLPIKKTADEYTITAIIRHTAELEQDRIPIHFIMTFPSGEERIWEQTFVIRDRDGNYQGVMKDGIYEIVTPFRTRIRYREAGTCTITAEQFIPKYNTQGVVAFGLRLSRN